VEHPFLVLREVYGNKDLRSLFYDKLPDGIYLDPKIDQKQFVHTYVGRGSKRLALSLFLRRFGLKKSCKFQLAGDVEKPRALRHWNDNLLLWFETEFLKIPVTEVAKRRLRVEQAGMQKILDTPMAQFLPRVSYQDVPVLLSRSALMRPLEPNHHTGMIDRFVASYFSIAKDTGWSHGDLHINNMLQGPEDKIYIIDWDLEKAPAFIDVISFCLHFIGFYVFSDYFKALEMALQREASFSEEIDKVGFAKLADCWREGYSYQMMRGFLDQRKQWFANNRVGRRSDRRFELIYRKYVESS